MPKASQQRLGRPPKRPGEKWVRVAVGLAPVTHAQVVAVRGSSEDLSATCARLIREGLAALKKSGVIAS